MNETMQNDTNTLISNELTVDKDQSHVPFTESASVSTPLQMTANEDAISATDDVDEPAETTVEALPDAAETSDGSPQIKNMAAITHDQLTRMLIEAEAAGYRKALLERGEQLMQRPALYSRPTPKGSETSGESDILILNNVRPSVWG